MSKTTIGYCECKRLRSECLARCFVCEEDARWVPELQEYRCSRHMPELTPAKDGNNRG